ncbi:hypothetical protein RvY_16386 [Ramazzottius varieornatus]|uniref:Uncharacterized protein n=1 Tax=Ramazzottius varieornatus TaxID=947166 RepID=A0A1D1VY81_RAMVA|nr:hypothetical protein RvY_16386 [Ramazzottius varieornatus]
MEIMQESMNEDFQVCYFVVRYEDKDGKIQSELLRLCRVNIWFRSHKNDSDNNAVMATMPPRKTIYSNTEQHNESFREDPDQ